MEQFCILIVVVIRKSICDTIIQNYTYTGLPKWLSGKELACQCRRHGFDPQLGRSPGEGYSNPLQYSCLENCKRVGHDLMSNQ